ncbi:MAG: 23S rRNA (guanosine(2251)-2'-O)-methyltransferase RlmB, partial [Bacteroidia bacterium]|nr:23S rRNA (guanosine(2251)-2'-O)-methyltransferase RlmB [Bacteroidia bacterium]
IDKVLVQQGLQLVQLRELRKALEQEGVPVQMVPREKLDRLCKGKHQGLIAFVSAVDFQPLEEILNRVWESGKDPFFLILDRVTDVRNFGAICRTAVCAGLDAVIIPSRGAAQIGGDAIKTSAGALLNLPVCRSENLKSTIELLKTSGIRIVAITEKADGHLFNTPIEGPVCLILGSEEDGISQEYLRRSDLKLAIPMHGSTGSLNVSVAAALALYEVLRQRQKPVK